MSKIKGSTCGSQQFEESQIEYLYPYQGEYLLVPNTPVEVCLNCGMLYYEAKVLKKIEQYFFAIYNDKEPPDQYLSIPQKEFS